MRVKLFSVLLLTLTLAGLAHAQDTDAGKAAFTGKLESAQATEVKAEFQAYGGELRLKWIAAPGTKLAQGDKVAELEAPDLGDALARAKENLEAARLGVQALEDAMAQYETSIPEQLLGAERRLERAQEEMKHWNDAEKQQQVRSAELNLENSKNSIEDQEEELRQLEQLYKGNDLAKESQDIVLNRSKRRLAQSHERHKMATDRHKRHVEVDIPRREQDMAANIKNAEIDLARLRTQKEHGNADLVSKLIRARRGLADAQQQIEKLNKDAGALTVNAPHGGWVMSGSDGVSGMKVGDKLGRGATLASVVDTSILTITVPVQVSARAKYQPGAKVSIKSDELGATGAGKVVLVGMLVRDGKVSARVEVDNADGKFLPGAKATIGLLE